MSKLLFRQSNERIVIHSSSSDDDPLWPVPLLPERSKLLTRNLSFVPTFHRPRTQHLSFLVHLHRDRLRFRQVGSSKRFPSERDVLENFHQESVRFFVVELEFVVGCEDGFFHFCGREEGVEHAVGDESEDRGEGGGREVSLVEGRFSSHVAGEVEDVSFHVESVVGDGSIRSGLEEEGDGRERRKEEEKEEGGDVSDELEQKEVQLATASSLFPKSSST